VKSSVLPNARMRRERVSHVHAIVGLRYIARWRNDRQAIAARILYARNGDMGGGEVTRTIELDEPRGERINTRTQADQEPTGERV